MRDYTRHFYTIDDTPVFQFEALKYYWFRTPAECQAFIDSYAGSSPGGGTLTPVASAWFRWNKNLLNVFLNSSALQNIGPTIQQDEKEQNVYGESPRNLGINSHVESTLFKKRQAKAGTQPMSFYSYLLGLEAQWFAIGYPQRWLEALAIVTQHYKDAKVTISQVTAWLLTVDLRAKATTI